MSDTLIFNGKNEIGKTGEEKYRQIIYREHN